MPKSGPARKKSPSRATGDQLASRSTKVKAEAARSADAKSELDDLDLQLIQLLLQEVRATNRSLATQTGVTEWTVAARVRRLREQSIIASTLVVDWRLAGYQFSSFCFIKTDGRSLAAVSAELSNRPEMKSVTCTIGAANVIAHILAKDLSELRRSIDWIGDLEGVTATEVMLVTEFHRLVYDRAPLPLTSWNPNEVAGVSTRFDDLDRHLMACLIRDANQSNREIARQLDVSENAIRSRLRRLEESGLARVISVVDSVAAGGAVAAFFALRCHGGARSAIVSQLRRRKEIPVISSCLGSYDVVGIVLAESIDAVTQVIGTIHTYTGVDTLVQYPIVSNPLNRYHITYLG